MCFRDCQRGWIWDYADNDWVTCGCPKGVKEAWLDDFYFFWVRLLLNK